MWQLQLDDDQLELQERSWKRIVEAHLECVGNCFCSMGISYYTFIFDAYGGESTFPPILASLHLESAFKMLFIVEKMYFHQNQRQTEVIVCLTSDSSKRSS